MKYLVSFFFFLISLNLISQQKFSKSVHFITDNDLYTSPNRDRYYTSGIFLTYSYLAKNNTKNIEKRIYEWQIGHEMFTPNSPIVRTINEHDRPFAAHLFGGFNIKRVFNDTKILSTSLRIGVLGPNALGDEIQNAIHSLYGFREVTGWKYQIRNAISLNFGAEYVHFLGIDNSKTLDASWISSANAGTVYTDLSSGLKVRLSFIPLQNIKNTVAFNTNLNDKNTNYTNKVESFFYFKPMVRFALYDATLQGSFLNTTSLVTKELVPIVFDMELGFKFASKRFNFGYIFNYNTSKSKGLRHIYGNKYGSIIINYMIH